MIRVVLCLLLALTPIARASVITERRGLDPIAFVLAQAESDSLPVEAVPPDEGASEGEGLAAGPADPGATEVTPVERARREAALDGLRRQERSAAAAIWMTMVFPGWGQLYADSPFWGTVAFGAQMYFLGNILVEAKRAERHDVQRNREEVGSVFRTARDAYVVEHRERSRDFVWWSAAGFLIVALDAYVSVSLADFDDPYPPTPDLDREWSRTGDSGEGLAVRLNFDF